MSDNYLKYDVWERRDRRPARARKNKDNGGGLFLPFRIQEIRLSSAGCDESVLSACHPKDEQRGQRTEGLKYAPPVPGILGDDELSQYVPQTAPERTAETEALIGELRAALEARDGPFFEEIRRKLRQQALWLSPDEIEGLEDTISRSLGPTWWKYVEEDAEDADRFRKEHIGVPVAQEKQGPPMHATQVETKMAHAVMRYGGLHLGPRFRTRATTYGGSGFRPGSSTFF